MDKHPYNDKNNDNNHDKTINNKLIITQTEYKEQKPQTHYNYINSMK